MMRTLYLLPNLLHEASSWHYPPPFIEAMIAESHKGGYAYMKKWGLPKLPLYLLNEHTRSLEELLEIPESTVGLMSDAGLPCIADPGAELVAQAQKRGIQVIAIPGPNSLLMALQLSGLTGQSFAFHGYFPRDEKEFEGKVRKLCKAMTHLFIETPYRTEKSFYRLLHCLTPLDRLCVAQELMGPEQWVQTHSIQEWKKIAIPAGKRRTVFLIQRAV